MMPRNVVGLLLALPGLTGCAVFETSHAEHKLNPGMSYPAIPPETVTIYTQEPDFEYVIVGVIDATGDALMSEARDEELAIRALKREAASIGADGVIITKSERHDVSYEWGGGPTLRLIKGTAIRRP
jgi:hypothetical protein